MHVRAKRLGWDEQLSPVQLLDLDPYDSNSDELDGELEVVDVPASPPAIPAFAIYLINGQEADPKTLEVLANAFCPTGQGGGVNPHCSPGGSGPGAAVHAATGLTVGAVYTKVYKGGTYTVEVLHGGFKVTDPSGVVTVYDRLSAASRAISGKSSMTDGWKFFKIPRPVAAPAAVPVPATPAVPANPSNVPFATETNWETGKPQSGQILNGIPFESAPPKFWEKTKDVDIGEPKPTRPVIRVGIMVQESDGRVWVAQPTNQFGNRKYTLPGGHVEPGLTNQQNAIKEVWEETGLQVEITGHLGDFTDSNNGNNGRLYIGRRIGGAPWDAKVEQSIRSNKTGQPAAESEAVTLVTKGRAAELLHRTDDLAQLATVHAIDPNTKPTGNVIKKVVEGITPAAKQYKEKESAAGRSPGDAQLHAIQELRGFNAPPKLVSKAEMDSIVAKGDHVEMLRGIRDTSQHTGKEIAERFRTGKHYPGYGCFGSGTYADSNKGSSNVANGQYAGYSSSGGVIRMALPKTAKVIKESELEQMVGGSAPTGYDNSGNHQPRDAWLGLHAALAGYDAIKVDGNSRSHGAYGKGFYVILNRGALVVQKEDAKGHVIT